MGRVECLVTLRLPAWLTTLSSSSSGGRSGGQAALAESGGLVAFATARRTHIVSLCRDPNKRLRYSRLPRPAVAPPTALPALAWRDVIAGTSDEPTLAIAWGTQLQLVRIVSSSEFLTTGVWHNADGACLVRMA